MEARGLPPKVLKWRALVKEAATARLVTTAASGNPFPIPFAIVTQSPRHFSPRVPWK